jgi:D-alanyl-D-alanine carboxypeptidase/D-alanyl-D-alanine-endopeptidase (penicillin-binding protein 4)
MKPISNNMQINVLNTVLFTLNILFLPTISAQPNKIQAYLKSMDSSEAFKQASWGFCLLSGEDGKTLAKFDADKSLVPASVEKVLTTSSAIALLGDTFRFKTTILVDGEISTEGILNGNIVIKGGGNPVLGSQKGSNQSMEAIITEFAQKIKSAGTKEIKGNLLADVSYFEYEPVPAFWTWYDIGNYYAPHINALNIGENQYELWFKTGKKEGDSTIFIRTIPFIKGLKLTNHTTTAIGGGDQTYIPGPPRSMEKHIYGKLPAGENFKVKGAIPHPEIFFLNLLKDELIKQGVKLSVDSLQLSVVPKSATNNQQLTTIYTHYSAPLSDICKYTNHTSNNLVAECLVRTLGAEKGKNGSTDAGIELIQAFVKAKVKNTTGLKLVDGSGLSKYNLATPSQFANYLFQISKEKWFSKFQATLPKSGVGGTLEKFCDGTKAEGKVIAKSGSMERIKCFAGYVKDKNGNLNPFTIMVNNQSVSNREIVKWIEGLMERCVE